jgi:hypothetical protein
MTYPFQKKSFWIILVGSFSIIFLFPPLITNPITGYSEWRTSEVRFWILTLILAFLLNYLGHLALGIEDLWKKSCMLAQFKSKHFWWSENKRYIADNEILGAPLFVRCI